MPIFGHKLGEECKQDHDCETGYLCRSEGGAKSCQLPVSGSQELGEFRVIHEFVVHVITSKNKLQFLFLGAFTSFLMSDSGVFKLPKLVGHFAFFAKP